MPAQAAEQPQRDAVTLYEDRNLERAATAIFFAQCVLYGIPDSMTLAQVQAMAARFLNSQIPVSRYWRGIDVSGPQHEAEGARQ